VTFQIYNILIIKEKEYISRAWGRLRKPTVSKGSIEKSAIFE